VLSNRASLGGLKAHRETPKSSTHSHDAKGRRKVSPPQSLSADFTQIALMQIAKIEDTGYSNRMRWHLFLNASFSI
jgi:hypothetical protein